MNGSSRNEQFFAWLWMLNLSLHLELDFSLKDDHHLVGGVRKVLPSLSERIGPEFTGKASKSPVVSDLFAIQCRSTTLSASVVSDSLTPDFAQVAIHVID